MKKLVALAILGLLASGCTEMQVFSHLMKRQGQAGGCSSEGSLKVGNPYTVDGITYTPSGSSQGYKEKGIASWYGEDFHGLATANGECYNMYAYTAAHKTLPLPTVVRVTNLENNKSIVLKVNDRGPFVRGRLIDLSYAAAQSLDIVRMGSAPVLVEAIDGPFNNGPVSDAALAAARKTTAAPTLVATRSGEVVEESLPAAPAHIANISASVPPADVKAMQAELPAPAAPASLPPVPAEGPVAATAPLVNTKVYVQVGAFAEAARASTVLRTLEGIESKAFTQTTSANGQSLTRVRSGPYDTIEAAQAALNKVAGSFPTAKIVVEK